MLGASFLLALPLIRFHALGGGENWQWCYSSSWLMLGRQLYRGLLLKTIDRRVCLLQLGINRKPLRK
ncbi:MAG: hypothetical protein OSA83_13400 [Pseudomonadales bacterium]|nr:hypothetical protein [Pseudomonadales bacterium]